MFSEETHDCVNDEQVFEHIDPAFIFDLFVESFFQNDSSWIIKKTSKK